MSCMNIPQIGSSSDVISKSSTMVALVLFTLKLYRNIANFTDQTGTNHFYFSITYDMKFKSSPY